MHSNQADSLLTNATSVCNSTAISANYYSAIAASMRAVALEMDIAALDVIRTDAETILKTESTYRGLIVKQARYQKHARTLEKQINEGCAQ